MPAICVRSLDYQEVSLQSGLKTHNRDGALPNHGDGALIRSATDASGLNQMWNIVRTRNGYYHLFNANSGRTALASA